jgi:hypothetical protein
MTIEELEEELSVRMAQLDVVSEEPEETTLSVQTEKTEDF